MLFTQTITTRCIDKETTEVDVCFLTISPLFLSYPARPTKLISDPSSSNSGTRGPEKPQAKQVLFGCPLFAKSRLGGWIFDTLI